MCNTGDVALVNLNVIQLLSVLLVTPVCHNIGWEKILSRKWYYSLRLKPFVV